MTVKKKLRKSNKDNLRFYKKYGANLQEELA